MNDCIKQCQFLELNKCISVFAFLSRCRAMFNLLMPRFRISNEIEFRNVSAVTWLLPRRAFFIQRLCTSNSRGDNVQLNSARHARNGRNIVQLLGIFLLHPRGSAARMRKGAAKTKEVGRRRSWRAMLTI